MRAQALSVMLLALAGPAGCAHGELPAPCYEKPSPGTCKAAHKRFHYDRDSGRCKAFIWGGCGGNVPFDTLERCRRTCKADRAPSSRPAARKAAPPGATEK